MSKENLVKLMQAAAADEQLGQQWQSVSSYEDVKNLAREQGLDLGDFSEEEATRTIGVATGEISEELSDEELEMVAGGVSLSSGSDTIKKFGERWGPDDWGLLG